MTKHKFVSELFSKQYPYSVMSILRKNSKQSESKSAVKIVKPSTDWAFMKGGKDIILICENLSEDTQVHFSGK